MLGESRVAEDLWSPCRGCFWAGLRGGLAFFGVPGVRRLCWLPAPVLRRYGRTLGLAWRLPTIAQARFTTPPGQPVTLAATGHARQIIPPPSCLVLLGGCTVQCLPAGPTAGWGIFSPETRGPSASVQWARCWPGLLLVALLFWATWDLRSPWRQAHKLRPMKQGRRAWRLAYWRLFAALCCRRYY